MSNHLREYIWSTQGAHSVENETNMQGKLSDVRKYMEEARTEGSDLAKLQALKCTFIIQIKRK